jgi:hypothetical protein
MTEACRCGKKVTVQMWPKTGDVTWYGEPAVISGFCTRSLRDPKDRSNPKRERSVFITPGYKKAKKFDFYCWKQVFAEPKKKYRHDEKQKEYDPEQGPLDQPPKELRPRHLGLFFVDPD